MALEDTKSSETPNKVETPKSTFGISTVSAARNATRAARIAAVLFITATATTMAGQTIIETLSLGATDLTDEQRNFVSLAILFEIANGLASAGIALALYPILRRASELAATGYLGLRIVEGTLGVVAAAILLAVMKTQGGDIKQSIGLHDATFLTVLIVFSCGTLLFYPMLYRYRLVPRILSVWGLVGGLMLLMSCMLILFGRIKMGGGVDLVLSLPIWVNEMALAVWLLIRGPNLNHISPVDANGL